MKNRTPDHYFQTLLILYVTIQRGDRIVAIKFCRANKISSSFIATCKELGYISQEDNNYKYGNTYRWLLPSPPAQKHALKILHHANANTLKNKAQPGKSESENRGLIDRIEKMQSTLDSILSHLTEPNDNAAAQEAGQ